MSKDKSLRTLYTVIAEYVWLDCSGKNYRSKTRTLHFETDKINNITDLYKPELYPEWNYDGSSTSDIMPCDANNHNTECLLRPMHVYKNPFVSSIIYDEDSKTQYVIVWCLNYTVCTGIKSSVQCNTTGVTPDISVSGIEKATTNDKNIYIHPEHINMAKRNSFWHEIEAPMFGFEQEFFVIDNYTKYPVGFKKYYELNPIKYLFSYLYHSLTKKTTWGNYIWNFEKSMYMEPVIGGQGPYYCGNGIGYDSKFRRYIDDTYNKLLAMGLKITGMNYEVAPGQAEFQICDYGIDACDGLHMLRWVLIRNAEGYGYTVSFEPVVITGGIYNNTGCHVNFSTKKMRAPDGITHIDRFVSQLGTYYDTCVTPYRFESLFGKNNCNRLAGKLETSVWYNFTIGIGTRHTSIRIPNTVAAEKCGYLEDRRPAGNVEPYNVACHYYDMLEQVNIQEHNSKHDPDSASDNDEMTKL